MHSKGIYPRTVNHPVMQDGLQLILVVNQRRWQCTNPVCRHIVTDEFSFVEKYKHNTKLADILIVDAFRDSSLAAAHIAHKFNVSDTYALTTFSKYVDMHRRPMTEAICIDEVHVEVSKVCNYALVIQDFVTGEPIDMIANRRNEITEPYFTNLPTAEKNRVRYLVSDMYKPYIAYVEKYFSNAISVVNLFM
ncbi:MAG TPA: transposase [Mogibacterium sp.]|nr:transposase [Mogibacterium sp.]